MKKIILLLIGLTVISCGGSDDENIIESGCPCKFSGITTELFPVISPFNQESSDSGAKVISFSLPYPCQDYIGRSYETDIAITITYDDKNGNNSYEFVRQEETYSFIMNQEWINAINSNGSIDGFNITNCKV